MYNNTVLLEIEGKVASITMNRPKVLNCINMDVLGELDEVIDVVAADSGVMVVIIKGAGDRAFVSSADIGYVGSLDIFGSKQYVEYGQRVFSKLESMRKVVIAAINGYALGGGCELALACGPPDRNGKEQICAAGSRSRHDPRFCRNAAAAPSGGGGPRENDDLHRKTDHRGEGEGNRPGEQKWSSRIWITVMGYLTPS